VRGEESGGVNNAEISNREFVDLRQKNLDREVPNRRLPENKPPDAMQASTIQIGWKHGRQKGDNKENCTKLVGACPCQEGGKVRKQPLPLCLPLERNNRRCTPFTRDSLCGWRGKVKYVSARF
jgi:hypothetical protein